MSEIDYDAAELLCEMLLQDAGIGLDEGETNLCHAYLALRTRLAEAQAENARLLDALRGVLDEGSPWQNHAMSPPDCQYCGTRTQGTHLENCEWRIACEALAASGGGEA